MKLDGINKIKQSVNEDEINEYLAKGYKIIKVFSSKIKHDEVEEIKPCYVLGLGKE